MNEHVLQFGEIITSLRSRYNLIYGVNYSQNIL